MKKETKEGFFIISYDLINTFDLHGSSVERVLYKSTEFKLELKVELCNWRQNDYNEADPELVESQLVFTGVSMFELKPNVLVYSHEILNIEIIDIMGTMKIVLYNNNDRDVIVLLVRSKEVEIFKN